MDILGSLLKTIKRNQFDHVMTDRYLKLMRAVMTYKTTKWRNVSLVTDDWTMPYVIPGPVLTDTMIQSFSKFSSATTRCFENET